MLKDHYQTTDSKSSDEADFNALDMEETHATQPLPASNITADQTIDDMLHDYYALREHRRKQQEGFEAEIKKLDAALDSMVKNIETLLTVNPASPAIDKAMAELEKLVEEHWFACYQAGHVSTAWESFYKYEERVAKIRMPQECTSGTCSL